MISGYLFRGIKNFKPFAIISFLLALFCFKTYFTENYNQEKDFIDVSGKVNSSKLIIKPKYKYLELTLENDLKKIYSISGTKLNYIENYERLKDKILNENQIFIKILKADKNEYEDIEVFSLKSENNVYLKLKDSLEYKNSNRKVGLWLGIFMILVSLFLLTGINIIIDKNGITITKM